MAEIRVGDPLATLRAVEQKGGVEIGLTGDVFNWSISPADGSIAELSPGPAPSLVGFTAKAPGDVTVTVEDVKYALTATLQVTVLPAVPPVPDSLEIEFTPGA